MKYYLGVLIILLSSCHMTKQSARVSTVRNNVCKLLKGRVVLYAIFVDSEGTHPWTEYDIKSTQDSICKAVSWIERQATLNNVALDIEIKHYERNGKIPVRGKFQYETLSGTLFHYRDIRRGIKLVDKWSDQVSRLVARGLPKDKSKVISTQNRLSDRERLIARLRDIHKTDNIALMYFTNNYFENEMSVVLHSASSSETEYAVVSEKRPSVIAHEFLHLFGALDLYISPFDHKRRHKRRKNKIMELLPNEIMAFAHKNIDTLNISGLTQYLVGWENKLPDEYKSLMTSRKYKLLEY